MTGPTRALATLLGAAAAGVLLWVAAQVGRAHDGGYWAACGIVAGAGLVVALTQLRGRTGHPPAMLGLGVVPVLVVAGWVLIGVQPSGNWFRDHVLAWSGDIGVRGVVTDVGTWVGVLAFAVGYVVGLALEPRPRTVRVLGERAPTPASSGPPAAPLPGETPAPTFAPPTETQTRIRRAHPVR
jgi:hypothetical protein